MLEFTTFKRGHLDFFQAAEMYQDLPDLYVDLLDQLGMLAQAGTHIIDGKIIYISGYYERLPGNWEVVIIPSVHLPRYAKAVVKDIRGWLRAIKKKTGARRLQTYGEPTEKQRRWLRCLGFTCDALLPMYDLDGDKELWSITKWLDSSD